MSEPERPDYLWDGSGPIDPEVQRLEAQLRPLAIVPRGAPVGPRRARPWRFAVAAAALAACVVLATLWTGREEAPCGPGVGMAFRGVGAPVRCRDRTTWRGTLPVGGWLETGSSRAELVVAGLGTVRIDPGSRVELRRTDATQKRLALRHGRIHARVTAPPRLFVVETAAATAWDLGCAYTLQVDREGAGRLSVAEGQVELARDGDVVVVPARTEASFDRPRGLGLPVATGASPALVRAVARFDRAEPGSAAEVIAHAGATDALTLIHLVGSRRTTPAERQRVVEVLARIVSRPESVATEDLVAGRVEAITPWRDRIVEAWLAAPPERKKRLAP